MIHHPHRFASVLAGVVVLVVAEGGTLATAQQGETTSRTVWDGVYTEQQAARGEAAFSANCARCHGQQLEGNNGKPLVGEVFWRDFQARTVDYLLGYMSRNMPNGQGGSLAPVMYVDLSPERTDGQRTVPEDVTRALGTRSYNLLFVIGSLDRMVGHRVSVRGLLVGPGGVDGINVTTVDSLNAACE